MWSSRAQEHLDKIRDAMDQVGQTKQLVRLRQSSGQSVLMSAASQAAAIFERGKHAYATDTSEGMSLTTLLTTIGDSKRL